VVYLGHAGLMAFGDGQKGLVGAQSGALALGAVLLCAEGTCVLDGVKERPEGVDLVDLVDCAVVLTAVVDVEVVGHGLHIGTAHVALHVFALGVGVVLEADVHVFAGILRTDFSAQVGYDFVWIHAGEVDLVCV